MPFTELSDLDFRRFSALVYEKCGIHLRKGKKELVRARLGKRLREGGFEDFKAYYRFLTQDGSGNELVKMLDAISTNLTSFFREGKHFDFLQDNIFPSYVADREAGGRSRRRFWSAGCSSGEEPYSLAMCLLEYFGNGSDHDNKVLATDISTKVLAQARTGVYRAARFDKVPNALLRKYFHRGYGKQEGYFRVKPLLKEVVQFRRFNLMEPFAFKEGFDLIFCRNVMIYFNRSTQVALVNKFYDVLRDGGYLFVGHSETLTRIDHRFTYIRPSIYCKL
ncbi:MAG: protein-glutamate O-methyltransferase CheR [Deltaproteobacteria bacterium]|nr:protein-glutamate O-methyltransferase CheR [Deltaproteobacteria bacterium]